MANLVVGRVRALGTSIVRWIDSLWGYDVFIAHRRSDGQIYAKALYDLLEEEGIDCFLDQRVYLPGDSLPFSTKRNVGKSTIMVLVSSPDVYARLPSTDANRANIDWVQEEIETYLGSGTETSKILVIDFGAVIETAGDHPIATRLRHYVRVSQPRDALAQHPHSEITNAIHSQLKNNRRDKSRLRVFQGIAVGLLTLAAAAIFAAIWANSERNEAQHQSRLALSRQLAAQAQLAVAQRPDGLSLGILLAVEALIVSDELGMRSLEADQALRTGLSLVPYHLATFSPANNAEFLTFTADSRYLIAAGGRLSVYDTANMHEVHVSDHLLAYGERSFSQDGNYFAEATNDGSTSDGTLTANVWDVFAGQKIRTVKHDGYVAAVALSSNGKYLATGSFDRTARVWDVASGIETLQLSHAGVVRKVDFSSDNRYLATFSEDNLLRVWDVNSRPPIVRLQHQDMVRALAFSFDSSRVAAVGGGFTRVWELPKGRVILNVQQPDGNVVSHVTFSSDGRYIATASDDGALRVLEVATARELARLETGLPAQRVSFSPDDRYLIGLGGYSMARIWEWGAGLEAARVESGYAWGATFSPNGRFLAAASNGKVRLFSWPTTQATVYMKELGGGDVLAASSSGPYLASSGHNGGIWDLARRLKLTSFDARYVAFSRNGLLVAESEFKANAGAVVYNLQSNQPLCRVSYDELDRTRVSNGIFAVGLSSDGTYLATLGGEAGATVEIWQTNTCRLLARMEHEKGNDITGSIAFSPDGSRLVTAVGGDRFARIWEVPTGRAIHKLESKSAVYAAAFNSKNDQVATASDDGLIAVWDVANGRQIAGLTHGNNARAVVFSPNDQHVASAALDGTARILNIKTNSEVARMNHAEGVRSVTFSSDGQHFATAGDDRFAHVWEVHTWREIARMLHDGPVWQVAFAGADQYLITTSGATPAHGGPIDRAVRVWSWRPKDIISEACARLPDRLTPEQWSAYLPTEPFRNTCALYIPH